jgi:hypothetical protein
MVRLLGKLAARVCPTMHAATIDSAAAAADAELPPFFLSRLRAVAEATFSSTRTDSFVTQERSSGLLQEKGEKLKNLVAAKFAG